MRLFQILANSFSKNILTFSFIAAFLLFSCDQSQQPEQQEVPSDEEITSTIEAQLDSIPAIPGDSINVDTQEGVATLSGSVSNLLAKQRATEATQTVRGVLSVVNNLKVTASRDDETVQQDVTQALSTDPVTGNYPITASVQNGLVTLKGSVDSWQQKQLASTITSGVRGVQNITNNILVEFADVRDSSEVRTEIENMLRYDARINAGQIDVSVDERTVTLQGSVGSAAEKQRAIETAHVGGVETVNAEDLEVRPELTAEMLRHEDNGSLESADIEQAIQRAFRYDPRVPADSIEVSVEDEVATLSGSVENLNSKIAAASDALNTIGVSSLNDNVEVEREVVVTPDVPTTDEAIQTRIENGILRDPYVQKTDITVNVDNGVVELSGEVDSEFKKQQIEEITANVKGTIAIDNQLEVISGGSENVSQNN